MGFNIGLATKRGGELFELPDAKDFPAEGWDGGRYGWDFDYFGDLIEPSETKYLDVYRGWDGHCNDERCFRPSPEQLVALRAKHPGNPRCQRIVDLLEADSDMVVFIT